MSEKKDVVITRRRMDCCFLPAFIAGGVIGQACAIYTGHWEALVVPLSVVLMWIPVRLLTPKEGLRARSIRGTPGLIPFLAWLGFAFALMVAVLYWEQVLLGRAWDEPLRTYQWVGCLILFVVMISGVHLIERRWPESFRCLESTMPDEAAASPRPETPPGIRPAGQRCDGNGHE